MIVFVDPKSGRGGGQVVLEHLLAELASCDVPLGLVMPEAGRRSLSLPHALTAGSSLFNVLSGRLAAEPVLRVANANASFPAVVMGGAGERLRRRPVRTVGIVHNYPSGRLTGVATDSR